MKRVFKTAALGWWLLLMSACTTDQDISRVVEVRIQALQSGDLNAFLNGDYYYVGEIDKMEDTQPKVVWKKETERIKQKHKARFDESLSQTPVSSGNSYAPNPGGIFRYKDMRWKVLEVKRSSSVLTHEGRTLSSARVFVECEFKSKDQSPYERYGHDPYGSPKYAPEGKPLKKAIVAFNVVTALSKPTIVDNIEVVEGREYWEVPPH